MQNNATFRNMRRFKQQLTEQECETILQGLCFTIDHITGKRVKEY